jgi:signal transduction histidine kinase
VKVERDLEPVGAISGDEERFRQVLVNLLLNAFEAAGEGGSVRVSCRAAPEDPVHPDGPPRVEVAVDDSGPGVPEAVRERIFEPFFTTKARGSGLGLSIVHAIIAQHGGTISVQDAPEGGARFLLRLPATR